MRIFSSALLLVCLAISQAAIADETEDGQVVVSRYKLAAMTGLMHASLSNYKSQLDPRGKQCVLISLGREFSGEFLFFAQRVGADNLEIVTFAPREDGGKEWSGRFVKFEGDVKEQFEKIHTLLGDLTRRPKEQAEDFRGIHGDARFEIRVGDGDTITWAQPQGGFIRKTPEFKKGLQDSISIASSMSGIALPNTFEDQSTE